MKLNPCLLSFAVLSGMYSSIAVANDVPTTTLQTITIVAQNTANKHQKDDISHTDSIPAKQADTLGDYLPQVAGVNVGGTSGFNQHISIRGIGSDFHGSLLKVTVDGVRQPETRSFHHTGSVGLDPDLYKATEVSVGNNSVTLGNNAMGGAVAFRTVDAEDLLRPDEKVGARLKVGYASNDKQFHSTATAYGKPTDNSDVLISYGQRNSDGGKDGDGQHIQGDDITIKNILAKASFKPADGHKISASFQQYDNKGKYPFRPDTGYRGSSQTLRGDVPVRDEDGKIVQENGKDKTQTVDLLYKGNTVTNVNDGFLKSKTVSIGYDYTPNDDLEVTAKLYQLENEGFIQGFRQLNDKERNGTNQAQLMTMPSKGKTTGFNWNVNQNFSQTLADKTLNHRFTYGTEIYKKSLTQSSGVPFKATSSGLYAQDRINFGKLTLTPGLRYDKYQIKTVQNGSKTYDKISGALAGEYKILPNTTVFASYTQLFNGPRLPEGIRNASTLYDLNKIVPEKGANAEIGFNTRFNNVIRENDSLNFTAKYFNTDYQDKIVMESVNSPQGYNDKGEVVAEGKYASKYINAGDVKYKGYEIMSNYHLNNFGVNFGYAHAKSKDAKGYQLNSDSGNQLTLGVNYGDVDNYLIGLNLRHVQGFSRKEAPTRQIPTGINDLKGFTTVDLTGSYKPAKLKNVSIDAGIYNLTDEMYAEHSSRNADYAMGRNVKLAVTYQF